MLDRLLAANPSLRRWWRYAVTSAVATAVSETTLLALYGSGLLGATTAAVAANLAGTLPSYFMSRYWIWPEGDRTHAARQVVTYWLISIVSLVVSTVATGVAAAHAPGDHAARVVVVGVAYVGTYGALWIAKFALYHFVVFRAPSTAAGPDAATGSDAEGTLLVDTQG